MFARSALIGVASLLLPLAATAQHGDGGAAPPVAAPREASQFDFLIGEWNLDVRPQVSSIAALVHGVPKLKGTWKAARAFDGFGIQDELRITESNGTARSLSQCMRVYDASAQRWSQTTLDVYRARFIAGTATWSNGVMTATAPGKDADGKAVVGRARFSDISPKGFKFTQDRSYDGGTTWKDPTLLITARRSGGATK